MEPLLSYSRVFAGASRYDEAGNAYPFHAPEGIRLVLTPAEKSEVVVAADRPWEIQQISHITVRQDAGKYRMWYGARSGAPPTSQFMCYAESEDGFRWNKPELGLYEFEGSKKNNICLVGPHALRGSVFIDENPAGGSRYKKLGHSPRWYDEAGNEISNKEGLAKWKELGEQGYNRDEVRKKVRLVGTHRAMTSVDGIRWTVLEEPVFKAFCDSQTVAYFDVKKNRYVGYFRTKIDGRRAVGMSETENFSKWPVPKPILAADALDGPSDSLYTNAYCRYPGADLHLMFPAVFHQVDCSVEMQLAVSSNGVNWSRPSREPIVPRGENGSGDEGGVYGGPGLVVLPDGRFALPYIGRTARHHEVYYRDVNRAGHFRLAMWPEHRLGGIRSDNRGAFTLESRKISGGELVVNYTADRGGWIRAALYENIPHPPEPADPLPGYSFDECERVSGDQFRHPLKWKGIPDLSPLAGKKVNIRFEMNRATLYAFELGTETNERHST